MSKGILNYRLYRRQDSEQPDSEGKWYGRVVPTRTYSFEDLVEHMSEHNTPYSQGVIHGVLKDMLLCVKELVLDGKQVRLGDLGLFSVGISSKGALSADKWTVGSNVTGVHLIVRNTKTWSNSELRKLCSLEELNKYNPEEEADAPAEGTDEEEVNA